MFMNISYFVTQTIFKNITKIFIDYRKYKVIIKVRLFIKMTVKFTIGKNNMYSNDYNIYLQNKRGRIWHEMGDFSIDIDS